MTYTDRRLGVGGTPEVIIPPRTKYSVGVVFDGRREAELTATIASMNQMLFGEAFQAQEVQVFSGTASISRGQTATVQPEVQATAGERPGPLVRRSQRLTPIMRY